MLADNYTNVRDNFKKYCDKIVTENESVLVTRKDDKHIVMISLEQYNQFTKAVNNLEYLISLNESIEQEKQGKLTRMPVFEHDNEGTIVIHKCKGHYEDK